jgi:methylenetetrahydrofolate--tRNA-(uracil-5-)-methyltransferase
MKTVHIIGGGLAGCEAAYFLAQRGISVELSEMRPTKSTPAHKTEKLAELVCSNSFKSLDPESAPGMMKREMKLFGSLVLEIAETCKVPAGQALGVDRELFATKVTERIRNHPNIRVIEEEVTAPRPDRITLIATGPLTSDSLSDWLLKNSGEKDLYFYDAIAPIIDATTIDRDCVFLANRYGKGDEEAYLNCPLNKEEYEAFVDALLSGEKVEPKNFEKEIFFQGCQPIEAIAASGRESLRFGPMKPVGLDDPKTGRRPYAVIQLRPENKSLTAYNLVGFQTKLKWGEQGRVFRLIPALKNAEFIRMGSIHRNTYVCGPKVLAANLSLKSHPNVFLAGQITGVEGYLESSACGLMAAHFIHTKILAEEQSSKTASVTDKMIPKASALGALHHFITESQAKHYQPMNACFALYENHWFKNAEGLRKDALRKLMAEQSIENFSGWIHEFKIASPTNQTEGTSA